MDQGPPLQYTYTIAQHSLFSCQRTKALVTRAVHYTPCTEACQGTLLPNLMVGYSLKPHALTATLARGYRGKKHKHPANRWEDNKGPPHESSTIFVSNEIIIKYFESPLSMRHCTPHTIIIFEEITTISTRPDALKRNSDDRMPIPASDTTYFSKNKKYM